MNIIEQLFTQNPMLIEIRRVQRRFFGTHRSNSLNTAVIVLVSITYAALLLVVWEYRSDIDPIYLIHFQTGLFTILAPMTLHSAIAGERERRSWDLLLVAPITRGQIVVGKFMGAVVTIGGGILMMLLPVAICGIAYPDTHPFNLILAEFTSITFVFLVCAITILFSARSRRPFVALGTTLGILFVTLIVLPGLFGSMTASDAPLLNVLFFLHPFYVLTQIDLASAKLAPGAELPQSYAWFGIPQIAVYLGLTITVLVWAERTLRFADSDQKFVTRRQEG